MVITCGITRHAQIEHGTLPRLTDGHEWYLEQGQLAVLKSGAQID